MTLTVLNVLIYEYDKTYASMNCENKLSFIFLEPDVANYPSTEHFYTISTAHMLQYLFVLIIKKNILNFDWQVNSSKIQQLFSYVSSRSVPFYDMFSLHVIELIPRLTVNNGFR